MIKNEKQIERILELFYSLMEKKIFLSKWATPKTVCELCNCKLSILNRALKEQLGFSIGQIIALHRVQYARELLLIGVKYGLVYKYSGFNSHKELEKALESIAN